MQGIGYLARTALTVAEPSFSAPREDGCDTLHWLRPGWKRNDVVWNGCAELLCFANEGKRGRYEVKNWEVFNSLSYINNIYKQAPWPCICIHIIKISLRNIRTPLRTTIHPTCLPSRALLWTWPKRPIRAVLILAWHICMCFSSLTEASFSKSLCADMVISLKT